MNDHVPRATVERRPRFTFAWLLPLAALAATVYFLREQLYSRGPLVRVQAVHGHGIREGDSVRHLGISVGIVEEVRLGSTLDHVDLALRLAPEAAGLAREGSRFWVVRPHLAIDSISGLETIVGARHVAVLPGPEDGERRSEFVALEDPPLPEVIEPGGVEVVLAAPARYGLAAGAPVEYREVRVGTVLAVGLASDGSSVEARLYVRPAYAELVREKTVFWEGGGFDLQVGLTTGLSVHLGSLRTLLVGAVRFATPPDGGAVVRTGHRFALASEPEEEWLEWQPNVPVGTNALAPGAPLPNLVRARLVWREGRILKRQKEQAAWLLRTADGLVGPLDALAVPEDALDGRANLELDGTEHELGGEVVAEDLGHGLGRVPVGAAATTPPRRRLGAAEDLLLHREAGATPVALDAARLVSIESAPGSFEVHGLGLDEGWHGAAVLARVDGAVVGLLRVEERRLIIASLPE